MYIASELVALLAVVVVGIFSGVAIRIVRVRSQDLSRSKIWKLWIIWTLFFPPLFVFIVAIFPLMMYMIPITILGGYYISCDIYVFPEESTDPAPNERPTP